MTKQGFFFVCFKFWIFGKEANWICGHSQDAFQIIIHTFHKNHYVCDLVLACEQFMDCIYKSIFSVFFVILWFMFVSCFGFFLQPKSASQWVSELRLLLTDAKILRPISFSPSLWNMPLCEGLHASLAEWWHFNVNSYRDVSSSGPNLTATSFLNFYLYLSAFLHPELGHTSVKVKDFMDAQSFGYLENFNSVLCLLNILFDLFWAISLCSHLQWWDMDHIQFFVDSILTQKASSSIFPSLNFPDSERQSMPCYRFSTHFFTCFF